MPVRALHLVEPGVGERETTRAEHKDAIAAAATEFFPRGGATVLLDAGTTTARIAALLPTDRELVVVTNSVPIAARLAAMPSVSLQLLGGRVRGLTQAAVGEQALRVLDTLRVDIAFIGTNGDQRPPRPVHPGQRRGRRQARHGRGRQLCCGGR